MSSHLAETDRLFFERTGLDRERVERRVSDSLASADDGELYMEYAQRESLSWDDGRLKSASYDTSQGFGLRAVAGEASGFAHANELSEDAIGRAAETVQAVRHREGGQRAEHPIGTNRMLYPGDNPLHGVPFARKVELLGEIDGYARAQDSRVKQVSASLGGEWRAVRIVRPDGHHVADVRPLVRLNVQVVCQAGDRMESGFYGCGGRVDVDGYLEPGTWQPAVDEALRQALVNLESVDTPAGAMPVVLGNGWPGILLHEAVGHGLEGDFNRKGTSAFAGLMGERVAAPGVTVVDDGTLDNRRGSLTVDDEGTPSQRTTLIEDGKLVGYMQDRQNARLMGMAATGNGRRESHAHAPMPRMTNTVMLNGEREPAEIIGSVRDGLYAVSFGGGQVDITSGKFVFSCTEAYRIENGRVTAPVKGATLIGNGPDVLTRVSMIGNDMKLDSGIGTCGKNGQGVPVGVGQPHLKVDSITVGGTAA
mgnify:CR=1 FL=1